MCPHDPTDSSGATHGDDPSPARPPHPAADATRSGDSDPAGATRAAPDPIREDAATVGLHDAGTIDHTCGRPDRLPRQGPSSPADPSPAAATPTVPGYDLLEPLGEGGMGVVWKARQVKLNRLVALKMVLGEQRAGSKELIRFLAEAEAVAAVKHPHVVQVYEYGEADGRPFLAMEYLPGGSLADRLKRTGRLDPKAAAELVATLAGAVQAAHDLGIVHRDLKPGNVLYDEHGQPKVTDFGLAKRAGGSDLTATQAVMGTPAYMAPEQARGETKFVGPQADVYSLGVILYECLTGTRPFDDAGPDRPPAEGGGGRARAARQAGAGAAPGRGADLPEVPGEGPGRAVPDGGGAGGRPRPVRGRRAGERACGRGGRAGGEVGPAEADPGRRVHARAAGGAAGRAGGCGRVAVAGRGTGAGSGARSARRRAP